MNDLKPFDITQVRNITNATCTIIHTRPVWDGKKVIWVRPSDVEMITAAFKAINS